MRSHRMIIGKVGSEEPLEVRFVQDDDVIEALPAYGADQAFDIGILPGRARGGEYLFDTEAAHTATKPDVVDAVAIAQEISRGFVPGKCLHHLLCRPLTRGVFGDVEVDDLAAFVSQHQEYVEDPEGNCGDGEKVDRYEVLGMIVEERPPSLGRWLSMSDHVFGDRGLSDLDAEHLELPVHARRAPEGIFSREPANEGTDLRGNRGSPTATTAGFPGPEETESLPVPTYQGVRLENGECLQTAGPDPVEPDPEQAFAPAETQLAVFAGDHRQLLPERKDLQVEDGPASEQAGQGGEQGQEDCFHPLNTIA